MLRSKRQYFTEATELHKLHVFLRLVPNARSRLCHSLQVSRHSHTLHVLQRPGTMVYFPARSISSMFSRPLHQLLVFPRKRPLCSRLHYVKYSYWVELQTSYLDHTQFFLYCYPYNTQMRRQKEPFRETSTSRKQGRGRGRGGYCDIRAI